MPNRITPPTFALPVLAQPAASAQATPDVQATPLSSARPASRHAGKESFQRMVERERYRTRFSIETPAQLGELLDRLAADHRSADSPAPFAVVAGGGLVGYAAAICLREQCGYQVLVLEPRDEATRKPVLDIKRAALKELPAQLIQRLQADQLITRCAARLEVLPGRSSLRPARMGHSILADLADPRPDGNPGLCPLVLPGPPPHPDAPWRYPDPAHEDSEDFYDTFALAQIRDLQTGMNRYCLDIGIHVAHGALDELERSAGEFIPGIRMHGGGGEQPSMRPPAELPALVVVAEGKTARLEHGFGGADAVKVDEIWHQRNFRARHLRHGHDRQGGSAIALDDQDGTVVIQQIWYGPDGLQASISVLVAPDRLAADAHERERQLDALFARAQGVLTRFDLAVEIDYDKETYRSPPIPVTHTRARNPVHDNVIFLGDASGLGSPFNSRGANDGIAGQLRILRQYIRDPGYLSSDPALRQQAQERARRKFDEVSRVRHGAALDMLLQYGFYTAAQVREIRAFFERERPQ